ncbi:MAG: Rieske 2Fe-2S domain-containing protein [Candidatus Bathyarchaeia archaeon]|jgi:nitrite reductase/ring-hydroxylating ferredoxin subunit
MEKICEISDVAKGTMKGFTVKDKQILIANVDGNFYAMDAICSHMHGYLPSGTLEKNIVICPVHRAEFDVTSGKVSKDVSSAKRLMVGGAKGMQTYKISIRENQIYVDL